MRAAACLAALVLAATAAAGCDDEPAAGRKGGIVSLAPSLTEIVFAVGEGDALAGVTTHCDYPEAARALPKVGGYGTPNVELVYALKPDVVLVPEEGYLLGPVERLRALGVRVESVKVTRLPDVEAACERVGALVGAADAGKDLARRLRERRERVERAVAARARPRVLLVLDWDPFIAAGPGTFAHDLLRAAGAENAAAETRAAYPQLGEEALRTLHPERIFDASMGKQEARAGRARYVGIDPDLVTRPGPRLIDGLEKLAALLHPEAF